MAGYGLKNSRIFIKKKEKSFIEQPDKLKSWSLAQVGTAGVGLSGTYLERQLVESDQTSQPRYDGVDERDERHERYDVGDDRTDQLQPELSPFAGGIHYVALVLGPVHIQYRHVSNRRFRSMRSGQSKQLNRTRRKPDGFVTVLKSKIRFYLDRFLSGLAIRISITCPDVYIWSRTPFERSTERLL